MSAKWPDRLSGCQWYLSDSSAGVFDVNVEAAWAATLGEGVRVLVVDYPVDYRHEDLRDNMDPADSPGLTEAAVVGSYTSHGTAMASIIAARDNAVGLRGVAPRASLTWRSINSGTIHSDYTLPVAECVEAVRADGSVAGAWKPDCESQPRSPAPARFFTFALGAPSRVTIDLQSSLDTLLYVRSGHAQRGRSVAVDDDSGPGLNARVSRVFPAGVYTIEATTYRATAGPITLTVDGIGAQAAVQPKPEVSITAGSGITEGGDAAFTVSADPAPTSPLTVDVTVAAAGDFGVSPGSHTVAVPTSGTATLTVATTNDSTDEADGSVTATVGAGSGYTVSATAGAASVAVADDDGPVPPPTVCVPSLLSDAVTVSEVTGWRDQYSHAAHQQRWDRVLAALGVDNGAQAMTVADAQTVKAQFDNSR